MYYKVIIACGHVGSNREIEVTRYFQAKNALEAWDSALVMPRAKKSQRSRCVRKVEEVDFLRFLNGKLEELENPTCKKVELKSAWLDRGFNLQIILFASQ